MAKPLNLLAQIMEQETQNYEFGALLRKIYLLPIFLKTIKQKAFTFFIKSPKSAEVYSYRNEKKFKTKLQSINHTKHLKLNYEINGQHTYNMTKKAGLDDWFELFL
ncbi:hypothetical protein QL285_033550 [Trifolium repens]|jgi:hypothetical protein|nr:hypothetical protein QL285_033550 [Trifolium repens]